MSSRFFGDGNSHSEHRSDSPKDVGTVLTDLGGVASGVSGGLRHPYSPKGMVLGVGENERMFRALTCCRDISFFLVLPFIHLPWRRKTLSEI
ncbi:unnamed protein product [Microthlaspi erraticum]|uniref:Uncharacterized protein n=1 Tax=Microthlaspi erraticum TaxID=1685480 RepID=A0A6D2I571_9BRAS|nr:unnamed protein product [Microthlaspi erraticum]